MSIVNRREMHVNVDRTPKRSLSWLPLGVMAQYDALPTNVNAWKCPPRRTNARTVGSTPCSDSVFFQRTYAFVERMNWALAPVNSLVYHELS